MGGLSHDHISGPRTAVVCLLFLAGIGLGTVVVAFIFGFLRAMEWAWGLR